MALPRESVSISWDWFSAYILSVSNDDIAKEYFDKGKDDNSKVVLDTYFRVLMEIALLSRLQRN